ERDCGCRGLGRPGRRLRGGGDHHRSARGAGRVRPQRLSAGRMTHPWFTASASPRVLAHRGFVPPDAEGIVENTAAAFGAAHAAGAVYVESDCHLTADGEVVLFHDEDLRRVAGDPRAVAAVTFRELEQVMSTRGGLL